MAGDANLDGTVDQTDLNTVMANFGQPGMTWLQGNFDGASTVDEQDLAIVLTNYNVTAAPVAPQVAEIVRLGASPTTANALQFVVVFSQPVTGVDAGDFQLADSGTTATISSVVGYGQGAAKAVYLVTVSNVYGNGTLGLNLVNNGSIFDAAYPTLALSSTGFQPVTGSYPVFAGQVFRVASPFIWTGGGANNDWSTGANWQGGVAPSAGSSSSLLFTGSTQTSTYDDFAADSFDTIEFATSGFSIAGASTSYLALSGGVTIDSGVTDSAISANVQLAGPTTFDVEGPSLTVSGILSGSGGLTETGAGTLFLSGTSIYGGSTTVSAGVLEPDPLSSLPLAGGVRIQSGGTLAVTSASDLTALLADTGDVTFASGSYLGVDTTGGDISASADIAAAYADAGLNKLGVGTLTLNPGGYNGATLVGGGVLMTGATAPTLSFGENETTADGDSLTVSEVGTFCDPSPASGLTFTYSIDWGDGIATDTGAATVDTPQSGSPTQGYFYGQHTFATTGTYNGVVTITDSLGGRTRQAFQTVVNCGVTATGISDVSVNAGIVSSVVDLWPAFSDVTETPAQMTYSVTGDSDPSLFSSLGIDPATGELMLDYAPQVLGSAQLTVRATDATGAYADATFSATVADPAETLYWVGGPGSSWDNNSTTDWNTGPNGTGQASTWYPGYSAVFPAGSGVTNVPIADAIDASSIEFQGSNYDLSAGGGDLSLSNNPVLGITVDAGQTDTISAPITGSNGWLLVNDVASPASGGTLVLGGSNNYAGGTNVVTGTVQLADNRALGGGKLWVWGGATVDLHGFSPTVGNGTAGSLVVLSGGYITNDGGATSTLTVDAGCGDYSAGVIKDGTSPVALDVAGGTLRLDGINTYTGGTTGNVVVGPGGSVVCNWLWDGSGDGHSWQDPGNWDITPAPGDALRFDNRSALNSVNNLSFPGFSVDPFTSIEFAGQHVISGAPISVDSLKCDPHSDCSFVGLPIHVDSATSALSVDVGTDASLQLAYVGAYDGVISGSGSLTKTGLGTLYLTGPSTSAGNTWTGNTTVADGVLDLDNYGNYGDPCGVTGNELPTTGTVTLGDESQGTSGVLELDNDQTIAGLTAVGNVAGDAVIRGPLATAVPTLTIDNTADDPFAGSIGGSGGGQSANLALVKSGTGDLVLTGDNSFAGGVTISNGRITAQRQCPRGPRQRRGRHRRSHARHRRQGAARRDRNPGRRQHYRQRRIGGADAIGLHCDGRHDRRRYRHRHAHQGDRRHSNSRWRQQLHRAHHRLRWQSRTGTQRPDTGARQRRGGHRRHGGHRGRADRLRLYLEPRPGWRD